MRWTALFAALLMVAPAVAQVNPTNVPGSTVIGRLGTTPGPGQAIPFATLSQQLFGQNCISGSVCSAVNVRTFGAKCDGVTDDSTAINNADAAAAAAGLALYFPAGTCLAQGLNPVRSNLEWFGDGPYLSTIKAVNPGLGFDTLVWFGPRTATTQISNIYVHDLGFNGNSTGTNAVVEARNVTFSVYRNLFITGGGAAGFRTDTSTTTINTVTLRNHYMQIETSINAGKGFYLNGEKDSGVDEIFSHNNTGDGIYFAPANLNSSALCETTQLYGGHLSARDNGGDGIVFDEAEKYALSSIQTSINAGYGIRFKSSITGCTSTGSNSVNIAALTARNDALGAFRVSDSAYMYGAKFGNIWIRGDNSNVNTTAMQLDGVAHTQFGSVEIEGWPGTALLIEQGTPLGNTTQSNVLQFGNLILSSNGNVGATTNHGMSLLNSSTLIQVGNLYSSNTQTTGSNYEINISSTSSANISTAKLTASGGAGNNINAPSGAVLQIASLNGDVNAGSNVSCTTAQFVVNLNSACTTPQTGTNFQMVGAANTSSVLELEAYGTGPPAVQFWGRNASGTAASPGATANGSKLFQLVGQGWDTTWSTGLGVIAIQAAEVFSSGHNGTNIVFTTTPTASTTSATAATMQASGGFSVGTSTDGGIGSILANTTIKSQGATSGIGYATGAGGAVTQLTSRTTGVTLNNVTGAITLFNAAGSATAATFTVTDSAVAATDTIIVNEKSGTNLYETFVTAVAAGSFNVTFFTTGGTATDSPVFNFNVIKGSAN